MTVAVLVNARNKAPYVADCVRSVLAQTYSPMEILLSDQGSEDGTYDIMEGVARSYNGPNKVRLLRCPDTEYRGMTGMNAHLNWLHTQTDAEFLIQTSADDLMHPDRCRRVVETWLERACDYVATSVTFVRPADGIVEQVSWHELPSAYIALKSIIENRFGGRTSSAWTHRIWDAFGGLHGVDCQDLIVPVWAALKRGMFFLNEPLHVYLRHQDPNNTGLETRLLMADGEDAKMVVSEQIHYQMCANIRRLLGDIEGELSSTVNDDDRRETLGEALNILCRQMLIQVQAWCHERDRMTLRRISPQAFPI